MYRITEWQFDGRRTTVRDIGAACGHQGASWVHPRVSYHKYILGNTLGDELNSTDAAG